MGIIGWIVLGLIGGGIAKAILKGEQPGGFIVTALIGIAGAMIGGGIAKALGFGDPIDEFFDLSTWLAAIIGSIGLLVVWGMLTGRKRGRLA
ncbi:MAG: GlsB/YeaQ/YmgE family stress response membrane protein [Actinobacteria bacterium]|nr:GlsB/YeaQ/YmgE family stress response membrane protein [Actinomycetota bacterium]